MPVLDTSFVIDLLGGLPEAEGAMRLLQQGSSPIGVATFTAFALYYGVGKSRYPEAERHQVDSFLKAVLDIPFTPEAAKSAGLLAARLDHEGERLPLIDLLIGVTALHHGEPVVTRNVKGFERVPGLEVLRY